MTLLASGRNLYIGCRQPIADAVETTCFRCGVPIWVGSMAWTGRPVCLKCSDSLIRRLITALAIAWFPRGGFISGRRVL